MRKQLLTKTIQHCAVSSCLLTLLLFYSALSFAENAGTSAVGIKFTSPRPAESTSKSSVEVKLTMTGTDVFNGLRVRANGHDITTAFTLTGCNGDDVCSASANLAVGIEAKTGWNYLVATTHTPGGAAASARLRFYEKPGYSVQTGMAVGNAMISTANATSSSTSSTPPYAVHVAMLPTAGIEVDYTPEAGLGPYYYPGNHPSSCGSVAWPFLTVVDLDRSTLDWKSTACFAGTDNSRLQAYLANMSERDLLLASTGPGQLLGSLNLAPIGGTDFTAQNAPQAYSYSIIGYGQASAGIASESYNLASAAAWHGLTGSLVNLGDDLSSYGFQTTDPVGFAVVPQQSTASITVGNVQNLPTGAGATPPSQTIPAGFKSVTYMAPYPSGTGGGIWVLVLDRYTLDLVSTQTFSSRLADNTVNSGQTSALLNTIAALDNSKLVFITTLIGIDITGTEGSFPLNTEFNSNNQYTTLLGLVKTMGVSPYAFDKPMGHQISLGIPMSEFAMVGIPANFLGDNSSAVGLLICLSRPNNTTTTCGANKDQWFSSAVDTQQNETGALKGALIRNKAFEYTPSNVSPFNFQDLGSNPTVDDVVADNLSLAIATAPPVPWPLTDTSAHLAAYKYVSNLLVSEDFYGGAACGVEVTTCQDIRFYYSGDEASGFATGIKPSTLPYPGDAVASSQGFTQAAWNDTVTQLTLEQSYLNNVLAYQTWLNSIYNDQTQNIGIVLTAAGTQVAGDLNQATGQPAKTTSLSPLTLSSDAVSAVGTITSGFSAIFPPAGVVGGLLSGAGKILGLVKDLQKTTPQPDPYVNQLSDLYSASAETATAAAMKFTSDLQASTDSFFGAVYTDWFKLQTVGLMSVNPDAPAWYQKNANSVAAQGMAPMFMASARKSFYLQTAGQYFVTKYATDVYYSDLYWPTTAILYNSVAKSVGLNGSEMPDYSWWVRDQIPTYDNNAGCTPETQNQNRCNIADGFWAYNFVVLKTNQTVPWHGALGDILMGPPSSNDGTGNLNLNRDVLYDSGIFPTVSTIDFIQWFHHPVK